MKLDKTTRVRATSPESDSSSTVGLLGVAGVAERLGTTERFVRRLVAERRVPFHKVGKYVRFDPRDIDDYLAERRVEATV